MKIRKTQRYFQWHFITYVSFKIYQKISMDTLLKLKQFGFVYAEA